MAGMFEGLICFHIPPPIFVVSENQCKLSIHWTILVSGLYLTDLWKVYLDRILSEKKSTEYQNLKTYKRLSSVDV